MKIDRELYLCDVRVRSMTTAEHLTALENTVFALCPRGNNVETFRFYEALETAAIPILTRVDIQEDFLQGCNFKILLFRINFDVA